MAADMHGGGGPFDRQGQAVIERLEFVHVFAVAHGSAHESEPKPGREHPQAPCSAGTSPLVSDFTLQLDSPPESLADCPGWPARGPPWRSIQFDKTGSSSAL